MRPNTFLSSLAVLVLLAGCAGADGDPLGGAHGGTTTDNPGTSHGGSGSDDGTSGTQGVGDDDGSDAGSGASGTGGSAGGGGGSSTGSDVDAGGSSAGGGSGSGSGGGSTAAASTPTWSTIYSSYLASGTIGNCAKSGCHSQMKSASAAYTWLKSKGQIDGTSSSKLGDPDQSILSWMGGDMPKGGPSSDATATADVEAWAAAGAANN